MGRPKGAVGPKQRGKLSLREKAGLEMIAEAGTDPAKAAEHLAKLLPGRSEAALKKAIIEARQRLQERAQSYLDLHFEAARKAASKGNSRPAEWALERIEADGERIVPKVAADEGRGPQIIFANVRLGGMKPTEEVLPIDVSPIEVPQIEEVDILTASGDSSGLSSDSDS